MKKHKKIATIKEMIWFSVIEDANINITEQDQLEIDQVFKKLVQIAKENGSGSQDRKLNLLVDLLKLSNPGSAKFITRIIVGKLRLGFSAMTILDALSWAVTNSKVHRKLLEDAYQKRADVGELAQVYLELSKEKATDSDLIAKKVD